MPRPRRSGVRRRARRRPAAGGAPAPARRGAPGCARRAGPPDARRRRRRARPAPSSSAVTAGCQPCRSSAGPAPATIRGSNCVPAHRSSSARAAAHRPGPAVAAGGGHRVEGVGDGHHPGELRDLAAGQPVRVAAAVQPLVVVQDRRPGLAEEADAAHHLVPVLGVQLDDAPLLGGQRPVLAQQPGGHAELADVVQDAGEAERPRGGPRPCPARGRSSRRPGRRVRCGRACSGP